MAKNMQATIILAGKVASSLTNAMKFSQSQAGKTATKFQEIGKAASKSSPGTNILNKTLGTIGGTILKVGGLIGLGVGFKTLLDGASASQARLSQLDAVLKSTGGAAGVSKQNVISYANSLAGLTLFSKGTTIEGENLLLTFTKIGKQVFPQATETMLDMSQALGQDTKTSAIQLGKALNDPIQGITALKRVGVSFSSEQVNLIKKLQASGRTLDAQKLILKELNTEFGGSAKSAGKTLPGQLDILKRAIIGKGVAAVGLLIPKLTGIVSWVNNNMPKINKIFDQGFSKVSDLFNKVSLDIQQFLIPSLQNVWDWVAPNLPVIGKLIETSFGILETVLKNGSSSLIKITKFFQDHGKIVIPILAGLAAGVFAYKVNLLRLAAAEKVGLIIKTLTPAWEYAATALSLVRKWSDLVTISQMALNDAWAANPIGVVVIAIGALVAAGVLLYKNWDTIARVVGTVWRTIKNTFASGVNHVIDIINSLITKLNKIPGVNIPVIAKVKMDYGGIEKMDPSSFSGLAAINDSLNSPSNSKIVGRGVPVTKKTQPQSIGKSGIKVPTSTVITPPTFRGMKLNANGGFANRPEIFGEAGLEAAIPIKRNNPRSLSLLNQTTRMLGLDSPKSSKGGNTFVFAPNISGGNSVENKTMLESAFEDFKAMVKEAFDDEGRLAFDDR